LLNKFISSNKIANLNNDILDNVLLNVFSNSSFTTNNKSSKENMDKKSSLLNFILKSLKNKSMAGVRLEAKGRLTRRFTASRSVFKIK